MSEGEHLNPFRGPLPYRPEDTARFFCRETVTRKLLNSILAHPCVTLFGPSGAGKSSLMHAAVIPRLRTEHGFRVVSVDTWRADEVPLLRLARCLFTELELGEPPTDREPRELLEAALHLAELRSERPVLIFLDQLEQPLLPGRPPQQLRQLLAALGGLTRERPRGVQLVLAVREDYLGRLRDLARGSRALLDSGLRLGPLTVKELTEISCRLAEAGRPAQHWQRAEMKELMLQMRTAGQSASDDAEVQAAFAQIVCRALWEERRTRGNAAGPVAAEPLLHRYLEAALESLGPSKAHALRLLEDRLVARDGSRTLLTQAEAIDELGLPPEEAERVLGQLQDAAVLHSEHHQGSRYFELGHDWLANKVAELKHERQRRERKDRELRAEVQRHRRERAKRRRLLLITLAASAITLLMLLLGALAWWAEREAARHEARAFNLSVMAGAREMMQRGQPAVAMKLLETVKRPEQVPGWQELALEALDSNFLEVTLHGAEGQALNGASFSPDGSQVVSGSDDGIVRVWNATGHERPRELLGHQGPVTSAEFSRDGAFILSASRDGTARVWSASSGEALHVFEHAGPVRSAAFSPDGLRIVTVSQQGVARLWWRDSPGVPLATLEPAGGERLNFAAFSPDGQRLVTTTWARTALLWRAQGTSFREEDRLPRHEGAVTSATFSPDSRLLVTAAQDGNAQVWRLEGLQHVRTLAEHDAPVTAATFSRDGMFIATASQDGMARVWRTEGVGPPFVLKGHTAPVTSAAFSSKDLRRLVTASQDGTARVWNANDSLQPIISRGMKHEAPVTAAAVRPDGRYAVTASQDGLLQVWPLSGPGEPRVLEAQAQPLTSVAFSRDGRRLVTASWSRTAQVWATEGDSQDWTLLARFEHDSGLSSAALSPDGQWLVTASQDGVARVWRMEEGALEPERLLEGHTGPITSVAFSGDGRFIATASRDTTARVWRADGGDKPWVLSGHKAPVTSVAFSPDPQGGRVVTASQDGTARVWEWRSGQPELARLRSEGPVLAAAFSRDGQYIATASWDGTARVWWADDDHPREHGESRVPRVLKQHEGPVRAAVFIGDRDILTASWDGSSLVWRLPENLKTPETAEIHQQLQERNHDCLLPSMRRDHLGEDKQESEAAYASCELGYRREPDPTLLARRGSLEAGSPSRM